MSGEIQKHNAQALARGIQTMPALNVEALINKAIDAKSAVEVIKELRLMAQEDQARQAKALFDEALSGFQSKCPVIHKTKAVPDRSGNKAYSYAPIEKIEEIIRPIEREFGFTHTFNQDVESQPGWVIATCTIKHNAGHSETTKSKFPLGTKTGIMSDTQVYASALTFANRRTLCNAYGLVLVGEDFDGNINRPKPVAPNAAEPERDDAKLKAGLTELWNLLGPEYRGTAKNWDAANQTLWREEILDPGNPDDVLPNISLERLNKVLEQVKTKFKK